jgi:hypothetical protein
MQTRRRRRNHNNCKKWTVPSWHSCISIPRIQESQIFLSLKNGSILCLSQKKLFWVHWEAWLHLVLVPEHLILGSLESMAPSCVCPRTSCFGFTGKHGSILCLSQNILFWVHWKARSSSSSWLLLLGTEDFSATHKPPNVFLVAFSLFSVDVYLYSVRLTGRKQLKESKK